MSSSQIPDSKTNIQTETHPGEVLKAEREKRGISTKGIAQALNLPERFIEYLEKGEFNLLPGHTFARGYIRNYAKFLGLANGEDLVSFFDNCTGTNALGSSVSNLKQIKQLKHFSNNIYWFISFIAVIIVIGVVFIWWQGRSFEVAVTNETVVVEPNTIDTSNVIPLAVPLEQTSQPLIEASANDNVTSTPLALDVTSTSAPESQQPANSQPITSAQTSVPVLTNENTTVGVGEGRLQANFTSNCWVSVTDAAGNILINKLMTAGTSFDVKGKAPLDIILGAPTAATVTYNGKPVTIDAKKGSSYRAKLGQ